MTVTHADRKWMAQAVALAKQGLYTTSPNPRVGCVIVKNDNVIAQGFHIQAGQGHAERNALAQIKGQAQGATAYVTLEPCSHFGRTPPCADGLIEAGISRVVVGMIDPNPSVQGQGIEKLRAAGINVDYPCLEQDCNALNLGFIKRMAEKKPYVRLKLASSLDGRTAMHSGESQWITGAEARADVQHYRALSCAIITGSGTVEVDQPSLNIRAEQLNRPYPTHNIRQPLRVVVDSKLRVSADNPFFSVSGPIAVATLVERSTEDYSANVSVLHVNECNGKVDLNHLLEQLAQQQINEVWVEAGAHMAGAFIENDLVDELIVYQAPLLMGENTLGMVNLPNVVSLKNASQWHYKSVTQIGSDIKLVLVKK
ncbi:bifunctional diaminohydroxyphosphoribosylaminopyrimidine deaminase/5-amino-6-(5-phosphoribosylamino)uracil reductase RibD [Algibacillus agarilyticus]|uniref:bifunctional diaminohydroxyphosphoribosylaminopyrimidine deaminase/5-amino-6-(5-phosphoribosylamino)uracil reductase RibD n=1 Tax=Algibacillus agarilyticus TaxID=2234133 RepID=UPI000DCF7126|nr:bifunctional diaminohydroxyphosphoribosylaminopyrimidine deaminase/5-amino-6-(5-phosphoribosylamino)uracil reductase RibD [Algibacillus agarilyticus]